MLESEPRALPPPVLLPLQPQPCPGAPRSRSPTRDPGHLSRRLPAVTGTGESATRSTTLGMHGTTPRETVPTPPLFSSIPQPGCLYRATSWQPPRPLQAESLVGDGSLSPGHDLDPDPDLTGSVLRHERPERLVRDLQRTSSLGQRSSDSTSRGGPLTGQDRDLPATKAREAPSVTTVPLVGLQDLRVQAARTQTGQIFGHVKITADRLSKLSPPEISSRNHHRSPSPRRFRSRSHHHRSLSRSRGNLESRSHRSSPSQASAILGLGVRTTPLLDFCRPRRLELGLSTSSSHYSGGSSRAANERDHTPLSLSTPQPGCLLRAAS